ncbi:unnamed protein product [Caenorhabditis auriculariae]|uniref:Uncharacterized protein n=1 Tax=Caenorhabditis auriculariae TaxID=2777116 RepID=A0A8S1H513_9PELO|nr:unnamed protein product [Caenorhabditis auriculariae]
MHLRRKVPITGGVYGGPEPAVRGNHTTSSKLSSLDNKQINEISRAAAQSSTAFGREKKRGPLHVVQLQYLSMYCSIAFRASLSSSAWLRKCGAETTLNLHGTE